jgi:ribose 5-phosphate isomerase B
MTIYIGADHRGFALKARIAAALEGDGHTVIDVGAATLDPADDYPDFARAVAGKVIAASGVSKAGADGEARGIVICGSGFGVDIVANKFPGVRSALAMSPEHVRLGRHDDDVNVLSIAADFIKFEDALAIARMFVTTPFEKNTERYVRRIQKITQVEGNNKK